MHALLPSGLAKDSSATRQRPVALVRLKHRSSKLAERAYPANAALANTPADPNPTLPSGPSSIARVIHYSLVRRQDLSLVCGRVRKLRSCCRMAASGRSFMLTTKGSFVVRAGGVGAMARSAWSAAWKLLGWLSAIAAIDRHHTMRQQATRDGRSRLRVRTSAPDKSCHTVGSTQPICKAPQFRSCGGLSSVPRTRLSFIGSAKRCSTGSWAMIAPAMPYHA